MTTGIRPERRRRLLPGLVFVSVFLVPVWLAWLADLRPGSSHWDLLWESLPLFCGLFLFVLIPSPVLKPACTLPEDHMRSFEYAVRTGTLPLASLFIDWTPDLICWRGGLERILRALPATILVSAGSTAYAAAVLPGSWAYFLTSTIMCIFLGVVFMKLIRTRLRNICSLEEQLQLQNQYLGTSLTKL